MALVGVLKRFGHTFEVPEVTECFDGLYRRVIYSLAAYIADYPEQILATCVVQGWCPKCLVYHGDLDGPGDLRSRAHRREKMQDHTLDDLWRNYGILGDVKVPIPTVYSYTKSLITISQPFTEFFPRADIHEMIAFDLLHQLIKGTFKDHLMKWIEDYLDVSTWFSNSDIHGC
jgi:hypothetical protein